MQRLAAPVLASLLGAASMGLGLAGPAALAGAKPMGAVGSGRAYLSTGVGGRGELATPAAVEPQAGAAGGLQGASEDGPDLAQGMVLSWRLPRPEPFVGERTRVEIELEIDAAWREAHLAQLLPRPLDLSVQLALLPTPGAATLEWLDPGSVPSLSLACGDRELRAASEPGQRFAPRTSTRLRLAFNCLPQAAGALRLPALRLELATAHGFNTDFLGRRQPIGFERRFLEAPGAELAVRALPPGAPADFCGLVGRFEWSASAAPTRLAAGDSLRLTLELSGDGDLRALALPDWAAQPGWSSFHGLGDLLLEVAPDQRRIELEFEPLWAGIPELPPLALSWFDPHSERYERWTSPAFALTWPAESAPGAEAPGAGSMGPAAAPGGLAPSPRTGPEAAGSGAGSPSGASGAGNRGGAGSVPGLPGERENSALSGQERFPGRDGASAAKPRPVWPLWAAGLLTLAGLMALGLDRRGRREGRSGGASLAEPLPGAAAGVQVRGAAPGAVPPWRGPELPAARAPLAGTGPRPKAALEPRTGSSPAPRAAFGTAGASSGAPDPRAAPAQGGPQPLEAALRQRLAELLAAPEAALFAPGLEQRLVAAGLPADLAQAAAEQLLALTAARYGGPAAPGASAGLAELLGRLPPPAGLGR